MLYRLKARLYQRRRRIVVKRAIAALPIVAGLLPRVDCYARPGQQHQLSCDEVSMAQANAIVDPFGEERWVA